MSSQQLIFQEAFNLPWTFPFLPSRYLHQSSQGLLYKRYSRSSKDYYSTNGGCLSILSVTPLDTPLIIWWPSIDSSLLFQRRPAQRNANNLVSKNCWTTKDRFSGDFILLYSCFSFLIAREYYWKSYDSDPVKLRDYKFVDSYLASRLIGNRKEMLRVT